MSTPFGGWYGFSLRIQKIKCVYISHICKKVYNIYIYVNTIYTQNVLNIYINNINNIYAYISIYIYIYIMQYLNDIQLMQ